MSATQGDTPWYIEDVGLYHDNGQFIGRINDFDLDLIAEWEDDQDEELAALAAKYGIKITVQVGDVIV